MRALVWISVLFLMVPGCLQASDAIWSDTLSASSGPDVCRNPAIASAADTLWTAWETNLKGNWDIYARPYAGGRWFASRQMTESDSSDLSPVLLRDRHGAMWFVWESKHSGLWKIYVRAFGGPTMTEDSPSPEHTVGSLNPHAVVDKMNRLWVAWQSPGSSAGDSADVFIKYYDGLAWSEPFNVTQNPADDGFPKVAVDSTDHLWVVWQSDRGGNEDIYATFFDGQAWLDSPLPIATGPSGDFTPQLTVDRLGRIWFAWMSNFNIFARYYDGELSAVFQLTFGYYVHQNPCLIGDASSNLWVVWVREEGSDNLYGRYYDGQAWMTTDTSAALAGDDRSPALAVDWLDNLWQAWEQEGDIFLRQANIPPSPPTSGFEPAGGLKIQDQHPWLRWESGDEPEWLMHYVVQVDDSLFAGVADFQYETGEGITTLGVPDALADNSRWFYRVQTVDPMGVGSPWSEIQDFYVDLYDEAPNPPASFTIIGLINGQVKTDIPGFVWSYGGDADPLDTAENTSYEVQIDDELCWCSDVVVLETAPGETAAVSPPLEENRTYYARVRAMVADEQLPSPWSDTLFFWINAENSPPAVEVLSPNGGEVWSGTQSIQWTAADLDDDSLDLAIAIELSSDGGRSWEDLPATDAEGTPMGENDGSYLWAIPAGLRGRDFVIRVTVADPGGAEASDQSDGTFLLSSMVLDCQPRLISPNGDGRDDEVTIVVNLTRGDEISVKVYDLMGRLVRLLMADERLSVSGGQTQVRWDGRDQDGRIVPNRLYIVAAVISDSDGQHTQTMTVMVLNQ